MVHWRHLQYKLDVKYPITWLSYYTQRDRTIPASLSDVVIDYVVGPRPRGTLQQVIEHVFSCDDDPLRYYAIADAVYSDIIQTILTGERKREFLITLLKQGAKEGCISCQQQLCKRTGGTDWPTLDTSLVVACYATLTALHSVLFLMNTIDMRFRCRDYNATKATLCVLLCSRYRDRSEDSLFRQIPRDVLRIVAQYVHATHLYAEWMWVPALTVEQIK